MIFTLFALVLSIILPTCHGEGSACDSQCDKFCGCIDRISPPQMPSKDQWDNAFHTCQQRFDPQNAAMDWAPPETYEQEDDYKKYTKCMLPRCAACETKLKKLMEIEDSKPEPFRRRKKRQTSGSSDSGEFFYPQVDTDTNNLFPDPIGTESDGEDQAPNFDDKMPVPPGLDGEDQAPDFDDNEEVTASWDDNGAPDYGEMNKCVVKEVGLTEDQFQYFDAQMELAQSGVATCLLYACDQSFTDLVNQLKTCKETKNIETGVDEYLGRK